MGALLRVQVPPRAGHGERSEAQLRKGDRPWGGSVERSCGSMDKNRIQGGAIQGERARNREALVTKGWWRKFGDRAVKECVLTWGDLGVEPERVPAEAVIEESADDVVGGETDGLKEWRAEDSRYRRTTASDAHFDGARMNTRGDEIHAARAVRNVIRRPCCTKLKTTRSVVYPFQPPGADPHARWCGRGRSQKGPPLSRLVQPFAWHRRY